MDKLPTFLILAIGLLCLCLPGDVDAAEESLLLTVTSSKLPMAHYRHAAVYDGKDSIFILGGRRSVIAAFSDEILEYNLSSGSVEVVASFPHGVYGLSAVAVPMGDDIFSFGGYGYPDPVGGGADGMTSSGNITRILPRSGTVTVVQNLPQAVVYSAAAVATENQGTYVFGGTLDPMEPIFSYNSTANEVTKVGEYPRRYRHAVVWDQATSAAYILGGTSAANASESREIFKFDPVTKAVTKLSARFPYDVEYPCAVMVKDAIYVIYGAKLLRFHPLVPNRVDVIQLDGLSGELSQVACAYVPELDRIYILGGYIGVAMTDQIMYIDMDPNVTRPPVPTTTEEPPEDTTTTNAEAPPATTARGAVQLATTAVMAVAVFLACV